jgi:hypothetical protein
LDWLCRGDVKGCAVLHCICVNGQTEDQVSLVLAGWWYGNPGVAVKQPDEQTHVAETPPSNITQGRCSGIADRGICNLVDPAALC